MQINILFSGQLRGYNHVIDHNIDQFKTLGDDIYYEFFITKQDEEKEIKLSNAQINYESDEDLRYIDQFRSHDTNGISTHSTDTQISTINKYKQNDHITGFLLQWHGVNRCFKNLKSKQGIIVRCRPDIKIHNFESSWLNLLDDNTIIVPWENSDDWFCDKVALGNTKVMNIYCDFINHYHMYDGNSEHRMKLYLEKNNIKILKKNMDFILVNADGSHR